MRGPVVLLTEGVYNLRLDGLLTLIAIMHGILGGLMNLTRYPEQLRENVRRFDVKQPTGSWTRKRDLRRTLIQYLLQKNRFGTRNYETNQNPFKLRVDNRALPWLKTYSMDQSYIGRWIVRLDGYHMIIEHRMRDKHQKADSLSKKTEFYESLEQKQANQAEIKEGFSFLDKETYEALPLTRWLDKSGKPIPRHPELLVEKAAEIKILSKKDPVPLDLLLRLNLVQHELSRMNINNLSLLDKTVQVIPQVMRMVGELLEGEVTSDDPEWAAAMASLTVSEKVKIEPSRRQHKEN